MNWSDCPVVETIPGKVSGVPLVKDSRVPAQTIIDNFDDGFSPEEIAEEFRVPVASVTAVIDYAKRHHEPSPA